MEEMNSNNQGRIPQGDIPSLPTAQPNNQQPMNNTPQEQNNTQPAQNETQMNPTEEIGFHKGALNTLIAERNELVKMVGNVDAIMRAHMGRLQELGVEVGTQ